jgi:phosphate transport system substrate-binding protein
MNPSYRPSELPPYEVPAAVPSNPTPATMEAPATGHDVPSGPGFLASPLVKRFVTSFALTLVIGGIPVALGTSPGGPLATFAARAHGATYGGQGTEKKVVVVRGSSTVAELAGPLSAALQSSRPDLALRYESSSSGAGLGALVRGEVEIAASSRPASEAELRAAESAGHALTEHVIARDGIAVVVHPDNPVSLMTLDQLRGVLTGRITSWSELGGRPTRINVLLRPEEQGSHEVIKSAVLDHGEAYALGAEVVRRTEDVTARVRADADAIGYVSFLGVGSAKAVKLTAGTVNPVPPSSATIRSGAYPLKRDLFVYTRNDASPNARDVVRFLVGPGQSVVREAGFVTLE